MTITTRAGICQLIDCAVCMTAFHTIIHIQISNYIHSKENLTYLNSRLEPDYWNRIVQNFVQRLIQNFCAAIPTSSFYIQSLKEETEIVQNRDNELDDKF